MSSGLIKKSEIRVLFLVTTANTIFQRNHCLASIYVHNLGFKKREQSINQSFNHLFNKIHITSSLSAAHLVYAFLSCPDIWPLKINNLSSLSPRVFMDSRVPTLIPFRVNCVVIIWAWLMVLSLLTRRWFWSNQDDNKLSSEFTTNCSTVGEVSEYYAVVSSM